jgi:hypothetical protein
MQPPAGVNAEVARADDGVNAGDESGNQPFDVAHGHEPVEWEIRKKAGIQHGFEAQSAMAQVEKALARKRKVEIHYVYRDFAESVKAMLKRALDPKSGRIVPIDDMARTHHGAQLSVLEAMERYQNDARVLIELNENETGRDLVVLDEKGFYDHLHHSIDKLKQTGQSILDELYNKKRAKWRGIGKDHDAGREKLYLSKALYEAARSKT